MEESETKNDNEDQTADTKFGGLYTGPAGRRLQPDELRPLGEEGPPSKIGNPHKVPHGTSDLSEPADPEPTSDK